MNYLTAFPSEQVGTEENPFVGIFSMNYDNGTEQWLYLSSVPLDGGTLIGQWDDDGIALSAIHPDYTQFIRPFGNDEGFATDDLNYHYFQGHTQRDMQETPAPDTAAEYPADVQPIVLTMERRWDDTLGFEGWGWRATIEFSDPSRPPDARAIGIYDANWNYQYTTGAFVWTDTGEVDDDDQPIFKWQTVNPAGRVTASPEPLYYALLWGSIQEGRMSLESLAEDESRTDYYWDRNQDGSALYRQWFETPQGVKFQLDPIQQEVEFDVVPDGVPDLHINAMTFFSMSLVPLADRVAIWQQASSMGWEAGDEPT